VFTPLVGALFATLDSQATNWVRDLQPTPLPVFGVGDTSSLDVEPPTIDPSGLGASFVQDVRDLEPVLEQILTADTFAALSAIAGNGGTDRAPYDDDAWAATVIDFAAAHHHGVMDRTHIVQALMPLYLGRVASFIAGHAELPVKDTEQDLERLSQRFERRRQDLIERWQRTT
jgi:hypothetical protein